MMTARRRHLSLDQQITRRRVLVSVRRAELDPGHVADLDTSRRTAIHNFIRKYIGEHGFSPTYREIGEAVGLVSPSSVEHQVRQLAAAGYVTLANGPRTIVLTTGPCARCGCPGGHEAGES